jgi:hypothetical protein
MNKQSSQDDKRYELKTMEDLLQIPADRLPIAMKELTSYLNEIRVRLDAMNSLEGVTVPFPKVFWVDDGKEELRSKVVIQEASNE